jgi:hypothetical protein
VPGRRPLDLILVIVYHPRFNGRLQLSCRRAPKPRAVAGISKGTAMDDDKKTKTQADPTASTKPLAVQVVDAIIDGAAAIAKSVVVETAEKVGRSAAKTKAGKVAVSLVKKAEQAAPKPSKKTARSKKTTTKKTAAKQTAANKPAKKAVRKASKKSPSKKAR